MKSHPLFEKLRIFAPGPTPVPEEVLAATSRSPLHHRTPEFIEVLARVKENLRFLFQTREPAYLFSASGTGAMEATVVNLFAKGDKVLVIDAGKFGERWGKIAKAYGLDAQILKVPWGQSADPDQVKKVIASSPDLRGVFFQASETSTGIAHPVKEIAQVVRQHGDALVVVDAITALGVSDLPMDDWGLDAVVSGSQKALMLPPGLAFLALSPRARAQSARANLPHFYFNCAAEDKAAEKGETAWTPPVSLICGLDVVLQRLRHSGLDPIWSFYARLGEATRRGCRAMGLELFAKGTPSNAVTAVLVPPQVREGKKVISHLRDRYGVTVAGGQDDWAGKMFRLAHLGFYDELDMLTILSAVELTLKKLGANIELGRGVGAASAYFLEATENGPGEHSKGR